MLDNILRAEEESWMIQKRIYTNDCCIKIFKYKGTFKLEMLLNSDFNILCKTLSRLSAFQQQIYPVIYFGMKRFHMQM